ncbi:MAG TPA: DUF2613 family protein [Jatrophihabitans sp.]|nr:DUF2613 family protein [Jatrophihabitans sp.]
MGKLIGLVASAIVGAVLAGAAVTGVVSSNTAAPKHNPASAPIVNYGNR